MELCVKIELVGDPIIEPCAIGEPMNFHGLQIRAHYDDGREEIQEVTGKMVNESNLHADGAERKSLIVYAGQKLPISVPLLNMTLKAVQVVAGSQFSCRVGEWLDRTRITVTAFYDDGSSREVTNYKVFPYAPFYEGQDSITIRYGRCKAVLALALPALSESNDEIIGIELYRGPNKTAYPVGSEIVDMSGAEIIAHMSDGRKKQVSVTSDMVSSIELSRVGQGLVTILYGGFSIDCPMLVTAAAHRTIPQETHQAETAVQSVEERGRCAALGKPGKQIPDFYPSTFGYRFVPE